MERIITSVTLKNVKHPEHVIRCDALVDMDAAFMVLPSAWKERLGDLDLVETVKLKTATYAVVQGEICGPVQIQMEGFRPIYTELVFADIDPQEGLYEPLIGYIVLEQSQAAVDMMGLRLLHAKKFDFNVCKPAATFQQFSGQALVTGN